MVSEHGRHQKRWPLVLDGSSSHGCVLAAPESADDTHLGWPPEPPPTTANASCFPSGHEAGNKTPIISRWVAALWCRMRHRRRKVLTANGWRSSRARTVVEPDVRPCTYVTYTAKLSIHSPPTLTWAAAKAAVKETCKPPYRSLSLADSDQVQQVATTLGHGRRDINRDANSVY